MSNFNSMSRRESGGDGMLTKSMPLHEMYANGIKVETTTPQKAPRPISAKYTKRTEEDIINERFDEAEAHARNVLISKDKAYVIIEWIKIALAAALSFGGGAWALEWTSDPANVQYVNTTVQWTTVLLLGLGPWVAYGFSHWVKVGVFMGVAKKVALFVIAAILIEEGMTMHAMRAPEFAKWFMADFAPLSTVFLLTCIALIGYLRSDLKSKRDLAEMKATEEDLLAKNATEARILKAKEERRTRTIRKLVGIIGHWIETGTAAVLAVPVAAFYRVQSGAAKTVDAAKPTGAPVKKRSARKTKTSSKTRAAGKR